MAKMMVHWVKHLLPKSEDLSLKPRVHENPHAVANICNHGTPNRRWEAETGRFFELSSQLSWQGQQERKCKQKTSQRKKEETLPQIRQKVRTYTRVILWSHTHPEQSMHRVHSRECVHMSVYTYMHTAQRENKQA